MTVLHDMGFIASNRQWIGLIIGRLNEPEEWALEFGRTPLHDLDTAFTPGNSIL